ncbi:SA1320 family protein [Camelliibacillus cellulosilyticus]|uniref:SA1320 family protein n=1 Tax=Camelliibacillus cellulosilyticus TaxID=2174486 RepID=A0ABV9GRB7_9BACL
MIKITHFISGESKIIPVETDKNLVKLAGYYAYLNLRFDYKIKINGTYYYVEDDHHNDPTGMDAMTVQNIDTGEYTIVYTGSADLKDGITDLKLLSNVPPAQIQAAKDYFDTMSKDYPITSICGNSLAGAYTNAIGIEHPEVKVVNLNPAILTGGSVDPDKTYDNITNYFSKYDFLTLLEMAGGYGDRIPGHHYIINNGVPVPKQFATNHTGYTREGDATGDYGQVYTIRKPGEPGYGLIDFGADEFIVTSIWTGEPLYAGHSQRIKINYDSLQTLAAALEKGIKEKLQHVEDYLTHSIDIVNSEKDLFNHRVNKIKLAFMELLIDAFFMLGHFDQPGAKLKDAIDDLESKLSTIQHHCRELEYILQSPPIQLIEHIVRRTLHIDGHFNKLSMDFHSLRGMTESLTDVVTQTIYKKIPELFESREHTFRDAVVQELHAHYAIIKRNKEKVHEQLNTYQQQVAKTATAFQKRDVFDPEDPQDMEKGPQTIQFTLEKSRYMKKGMLLKAMHLEETYQDFSRWLYVHLIPIVEGVQKLLLKIEAVLFTLSITIKGAGNMIMGKGTIVGDLIAHFTHYDERIRAAVKRATRPIDELIADIYGIEKAFQRLIVQFPFVLDAFKPYVENALFQDTGYADVNLYNTAAMGILEDLDRLFDDIVYQSSDHQAETIDALCESSRHIKSNMKQLHEQVERVSMV